MCLLLIVIIFFSINYNYYIVLAVKHNNKLKKQYHWIKEQIKLQEQKKKKNERNTLENIETHEKSYYDKVSLICPIIKNLFHQVFSGEINLEEETYDPFMEFLNQEGLTQKKKRKKEIPDNETLYNHLNHQNHTKEEIEKKSFELNNEENPTFLQSTIKEKKQIQYKDPGYLIFLPKAHKF